MSLKNFLLEQPSIFSLYQLPFASQKLAKLRQHADLDQARCVLDVGCGPGTNAPLFPNSKYLGIDINDRYIALAKKRYRQDFLVADVTSSQAIPCGSYDFILVNSFLHHLDEPATLRVLARINDLLTPDGQVHSIELVLPASRGFPHWLTVHDRGKFPRTLSSWREIFECKLQTAVFEPFPVRHFGCTILELVYIKGRKKA
jgi:SAM-dependent methyltransferase